MLSLTQYSTVVNKTENKNKNQAEDYADQNYTHSFGNLKR